MPNEPVVVESERVEEPKQEVLKPDDRFEKMQARMEFQARQFEKGQRELRDAVQAIQTIVSNGYQAPAQKTEPKDLDELDKIAEQDWKKAVKILGKEVAQETYLELRKQEEELRRQQNQTSTLEQSKQRVLDKYPMIEDDSSDESRTFREVLSEDPNVLQNPYGPEIAMYRMEAKLGKATKQNVAPSPQIRAEATRLARANAGGLPSGRPSTNKGNLEPTKEQKLVAARMGIPVEQYVKVARALEGGDQQVEG